MHTSNELLRRWRFHQKYQPSKCDQSNSVAAHTIIPSIGESDFKPGSFIRLPSSVLDVVLTSHRSNSSDDHVAPVRAYLIRPTDSKIKVDMVFERNFYSRPGYKDYQLDAYTQGGIFTAALDMNNHRLACLARPDYLDDKSPVPDLCYGFEIDKVPNKADCPGLRDRVWDMLLPGSIQPTVCFATDEAKVVCVVRSKEGKLIRLSNEQDVLAPEWANVRVHSGCKVNKGDQLFSVSIRRSIVDELHVSSLQLGDRWAVLIDYLGQENVDKVEQWVWESSIKSHLGRVFVPMDLVTDETDIGGLPVYRDISRQMGRVCRYPECPDKASQLDNKQGRMTSWFIGDPVEPERLEISTRRGKFSLLA